MTKGPIALPVPFAAPSFLGGAFESSCNPLQPPSKSLSVRERGLRGLGKTSVPVPTLRTGNPLVPSHQSFRPAPSFQVTHVTAPPGMVMAAGQAKGGGGDASGWAEVGQEAARQGLNVAGNTLDRVLDRYLGQGSGENPYATSQQPTTQSSSYGYQSQQPATTGAPAVPTWAWVAGGAVLVAGLGAVAVLASRKK